MLQTLHSVLRGLAPATARPAPAEMLRAALGAGIGLALCGVLARLIPAPHGLALPLIIAPFGATAFLAFAIPNSPLAQPWSAVVGNTVSALVAIAVVKITHQPHLAVAFAVALAILAMMLSRAMHPPGAALALLIALNPDIAAVGFGYALSPVALDTAILVGFAVVWNRATGRVYPFRQPTTSPQATSDPATARRLGISPEAMSKILRDMNLAANIGPEDLARLIGAAEAEAATRHLGGITARDVMSRDVVTLRPDAPVVEMTALFRDHLVKAFPVVSATGLCLGILREHALIGLDHTDPHVAADLMDPPGPVAPDTPLARMIFLMNEGRRASIPVQDPDGRLIGIITRSDLISALANALATS